eukprot:Em0001g3592a
MSHCFAGPNNSVVKNISLLSYSNSIGCSFLNNQSFYCMVCCSTDPSVPPDSSVYNISTTRGTEVTVSLQNLTSSQMYHCKAAATTTKSSRCAGPVIGANMASIDTYIFIGITIAISFVVFFSLGVLVTTCIGCMVKTRSKVTLHHPAMESTAYEMIENLNPSSLSCTIIDLNPTNISCTIVDLNRIFTCFSTGKLPSAACLCYPVLLSRKSGNPNNSMRTEMEKMVCKLITQAFTNYVQTLQPDKVPWSASIPNTTAFLVFLSNLGNVSARTRGISPYIIKQLSLQHHPLVRHTTTILTVIITTILTVIITTNLTVFTITIIAVFTSITITTFTFTTTITATVAITAIIFTFITVRIIISIIVVYAIVASATAINHGISSSSNLSSVSLWYLSTPYAEP